MPLDKDIPALPEVSLLQWQDRRSFLWPNPPTPSTGENMTREPRTATGDGGGEV